MRIPKGRWWWCLTDNLIDGQLRNNLIHGQGITLMLDKERDGEYFQKIITGENCDVGADELPMDYILGKKDGEFSLHGERYIICAVESPGSPYRYVSILPKKTLLGQIGSIKYLIRGAVRDGHAGGAGRMYWAVEEAQGRGSFLQQISG